LSIVYNSPKCVSKGEEDFKRQLQDIKFPFHKIFEISHPEAPTKRNLIAFTRSALHFFCSCGDWIRRGFPCRHYWKMFLGRHGETVLFHIGLINSRWILQHANTTEENFEAVSFTGNAAIGDSN
jgi:hypothetical protein